MSEQEVMDLYDKMADNLTKEVLDGTVTVIVQLFVGEAYPNMHGKWWCVVKNAPGIWALGESPEEAQANFEKDSVSTLYSLFPGVKTKYEVIH